MKNLILISLGVVLLSATACSSDSTFNSEDNITPDTNVDGDGNTDNSGDDLESFDITFDYSIYNEPDETIPTNENDENYDDFIENSTFNTTIYISFSEDGVIISDLVEGIIVNQNGAHISITSTTKNIEYVLSGITSDGSFKIYSDYKFKLTLDAIQLTNPAGAAINIQSDKRVFVVCNEGTTNTLNDGTFYNTTEDEDMKACFFSKGQLIFSGRGILNMNGNYKHALCSDDYVRFRVGSRINITANAKHGVKANEAIIIDGGALNIATTANASKGLSCDGKILINGGRTIIITSGEGVYEDNDVTGCAGIKCNGVFTMNDGILALKSTGAGGKGLNTDEEIIINGGTIKVITTGKQYIYNGLDTSPKGIKSDANITINGGHFLVRTSGGEGSEGIESKANMTINGGTIEVLAYDDGLNASSHIGITGGYIYCYSSGNDGMDSNGTLSISGGILIVSGAQTPEGGIDCDQNTFSITGGTVIGIGGSTSVPTPSQCTQPTIIYGGSGISEVYLSLSDSEGNNIIIYQIPRTYSHMTLLISTPLLQQGSNYILSSGGAVNGGDNFHHLITGGIYVNGSQLASLTISSMVTTYNFKEGMGGR